MEDLSREMTEREKAEKSLKNSEERLRIIFEDAPDAYYLSDMKGIFVDGNKTVEKLLGYKKEELVGESFMKLKLLGKNDLSKTMKLLARNVLDKPTGPDEIELIRKE